jgi:antitoxin CcdA
MGCIRMVAASRRKTSLTLDGEALDRAKDLGINVSAVAEAALIQAVAETRRERWLAENAAAFAAQSEWHERNGHPLADIMTGPGQSSWNS